MTEFRTTRRVEFHETDMAGIMHFSNFFRYMEAAEVEFLRSKGLSVKLAWQGEALGFTRVSATCDFVSPAYFQDLVDIGVSLDRLGEKSVTYAFVLSRQEKLLARGKITSVCCRVLGENSFESIPIPVDLRTRLLS